jgi:ribosomal protein S1
VANELIDRQLAGLAEGDVVDTVVTSVAGIGAFVAFQGVSGLVHRSELSWTGEIELADLAIGSHRAAKIIKIDHERRRVSLSFRQLSDDPMPALLAGLSPGAKVTGVVTGIVNFGAFVQLAPGVDGLIHSSELPSPVEPEDGANGVRAQITEGSAVVARVLAIDLQKRRLSLTLRDPHPWLDGVGLPSIGAHLRGTVRKVSDDGIRVALADRVLGIIGSPNRADFDEVPAEGSLIDVVVVGMDREQRNLILAPSQEEASH